MAIVLLLSYNVSLARTKRSTPQTYKLIAFRTQADNDDDGDHSSLFYSAPHAPQRWMLCSRGGLLHATRATFCANETSSRHKYENE